MKLLDITDSDIAEVEAEMDAILTKRLSAVRARLLDLTKPRSEYPGGKYPSELEKGGRTDRRGMTTPAQVRRNEKAGSAGKDIASKAIEEGIALGAAEYSHVTDKAGAERAVASAHKELVARGFKPKGEPLTAGVGSTVNKYFQAYERVIRAPGGGNRFTADVSRIAQSDGTQEVTVTVEST